MGLEMVLLAMCSLWEGKEKLSSMNLSRGRQELTGSVRIGLFLVLSACVLCAYVHVCSQICGCTSVRECASIGRPRLTIKGLLQSLSTLLIESGFLPDSS